jgi:hypothetical protein
MPNVAVMSDSYSFFRLGSKFWMKFGGNSLEETALADLRRRVASSFQKNYRVAKSRSWAWYYGIVYGEMELISTRHLFKKTT